ncbi:MAG TPA: DUF1598 domain-containing protein, partial [Planctomycetaceae bacterium]|nr:DUF1598 domain-containing protein [Planctomycetaceae bacterium]
LQHYLARNSQPASAARVQRRFREMAKILGMQEVRVWGVPPDSHFAQVLVEADYRMKRISIGLENPRVPGLKSHLAMLRPHGNTMQRWWFTPLYDAIYTTDDHLAFQIEGQRAQLLAQEEVASASGQRSAAAFTRRSTRAFAKQFTEKFPELAEKLPVFAQLQNVIDLAIVAALFRKEGLPEKVGWKMELFLDPERAVVARGRVPKKVPTSFKTKRSRGMILGLLAGGVVIGPEATVKQVPFRVDSARRLGGVRRGAVSGERPEQHVWWWD